MIKRAIAAAALLAGLALAGTSAHATCVAGRIGVDPKTHKIIFEPPSCNPPPAISIR